MMTGSRRATKSEYDYNSADTNHLQYNNSNILAPAAQWTYDYNSADTNHLQYNNSNILAPAAQWTAMTYTLDEHSSS